VPQCGARVLREPPPPSGSFTRAVATSPTDQLHLRRIAATTTAGPRASTLHTLALIDRENVTRTIRPQHLWALFGAAVAGLAAAAFAAFQLYGGPAFHGTTYADSPPAPTFTLVDHDGRSATLEEHRGRAVLLFFGFTRCPDVCPLTLGRLTRILREADLGPDRVSILLVSVDPEHDSPERLADFLEPYGAGITGLTGETSTIGQILAEYGVYAQPTTGHGGAETLAHTSVVFGIDPAGRLRVLLHADDPPSLVEGDIRKLLRARG
jgi:protein SCO1